MPRLKFSAAMPAALPMRNASRTLAHATLDRADAVGGIVAEKPPVRSQRLAILDNDTVF